MDLKRCSKCGNMNSSQARNCVYCGNTLSKVKTITDDENVIKKKKKKKKRKKILFLFLVLLLIIGGGSYLGFSSYYERINEEEKLEIEKKEKEEREAEYTETLNNIVDKFYVEFSNLDEYLNLVSSIWSNTVNKKSDSSTDSYTKDDLGMGDFYTDYNQSLKYFYASNYSKEKVENIQSGKKEIDSFKKLLLNPPTQYKNQYELVITCYDTYALYVSYVLNYPEVNYDTFITNGEKLKNEFIDAYNVLYKKVYNKDE